MSMPLLLLSLALIVALLGLWAFRIAPRLGKARLDSAQKGGMIALHMVTALAILSAGIFYLDEQQWSPRLGVEIRADPQLVPDSQPKSAVVQLAIGITNKTETNQKVNFIEVTAAGLRGAPRQDPKAPEEVAATPLYRHVTRRPSDIGPDETFYQFVEIPVACAWRLLRVGVRVPRPPAQPGKSAVAYERKLLVPLAELCAVSVATAGGT